MRDFQRSQKLTVIPNDYIVQTKRVAQPFIGYWDGREWTDEEVDILDEVIAWMPLPEPYKGE